MASLTALPRSQIWTRTPGLRSAGIEFARALKGKLLGLEGEATDPDRPVAVVPQGPATDNHGPVGLVRSIRPGAGPVDAGRGTRLVVLPALRLDDFVSLFHVLGNAPDQRF